MAGPKKSQIELGFNHNIKYKGKIFHVQTEDSGTKNPHIITHLFEGGNILATKKTSYADIIQAENLPDIVRELMQEQHKSMLRNLINGAYDGMYTSPGAPTTPASAPQPVQARGARGPVPIPSVPGPVPIPSVSGLVPIPSVPGPLPAVNQTSAQQPDSASPPSQVRSSTYSLVAGESTTLKETIHLTSAAAAQSSPAGPEKISSSPQAVQPTLASGKFPLPSKPASAPTHMSNAGGTFPPARPTPVQPPPLPRNVPQHSLPTSSKRHFEARGRESAHWRWRRQRCQSSTRGVGGAKNGRQTGFKGHLRSDNIWRRLNHRKEPRRCDLVVLIWRRRT